MFCSNNTFEGSRMADNLVVPFQRVFKGLTAVGPEDAAVIKQLKRISEGWFCITQKEKQLLFNDLRFGVMNADKNDMQFSFSYHITEENGEIKAVELPNKNRKEAKKLLGKLWVRMWGN